MTQNDTTYVNTTYMKDKILNLLLCVSSDTTHKGFLLYMVQHTGIKSYNFRRLTLWLDHGCYEFRSPSVSTSKSRIWHI